MFFNLSIVFLISYLINKLFFQKNNLLSIKANDIINLYFLVLLTLSLTPHIIVWATSKHLVGITNVCIIYFFEKIFNRSKINEKIKVIHIAYSDYIGGASRAALRIHKSLLKTMKFSQIYM